jgi:hypothetical protein
LSLIGFHRFLIGAGIVFCFGFAIWDFATRPDGAGFPLLPLVFIVLGVALSFYLLRLNRFLGYNDDQ